uniref:Uncharacterized protein n=1 Tax=Vitis vinifera TaxID=29760 RepID=F6HJ08_VITVI
MASLPPFSSVVPRHHARVRSPEFHHFPILTRTLLRYSPGPLSGTRLDFTRFRYLPGTFFGTRPDPSPVLAWSFFDTRPDPSSVLARILPVFGTCPEPSPVLARTLLRYSPEPFSGTCPKPSPVLAQTLFRYSPEFYPFSVLARIPPFFGTRPDSIVFRYLPEPFSGTCPDQIPNLSQHRDRVSFSLSGASCLDPIVHSVSMTYFP